MDVYPWIVEEANVKPGRSGNRRGIVAGRQVSKVANTVGSMRRWQILCTSWAYESSLTRLAYPKKRLVSMALGFWRKRWLRGNLIVSRLLACSQILTIGVDGPTSSIVWLENTRSNLVKDTRDHFCAKAVSAHARETQVIVTSEESSNSLTILSLTSSGRMSQSMVITEQAEVEDKSEQTRLQRDISDDTLEY